MEVLGEQDKNLQTLLYQQHHPPLFGNSIIPNNL